MAEFEFGGMTFKGGKMMIVLTALSTLGGTLWGGFEFYKDYMDMKEIIQNIDTTSIENRNKIIEQKLDDALLRIDEAVDYSRSIKNDLRDDFNRMEQNVDRVEDNNREMENKVAQMIDRAAERFDAKRDSLASDNKLAMDSLETRLNKKLQQALDNPLAN